MDPSDGPIGSLAWYTQGDRHADAHERDVALVRVASATPTLARAVADVGTFALAEPASDYTGSLTLQDEFKRMSRAALVDATSPLPLRDLLVRRVYAKIAGSRARRGTRADGWYAHLLARTYRTLSMGSGGAGTDRQHFASLFLGETRHIATILDRCHRNVRERYKSQLDGPAPTEAAAGQLDAPATTDAEAYPPPINQELSLVVSTTEDAITEFKSLYTIDTTFSVTRLQALREMFAQAAIALTKLHNQQSEPKPVNDPIAALSEALRTVLATMLVESCCPPDERCSWEGHVDVLDTFLLTELALHLFFGTKLLNPFSASKSITFRTSAAYSVLALGLCSNTDAERDELIRRVGSSPHESVQYACQACAVAFFSSRCFIDQGAIAGTLALFALEALRHGTAIRQSFEALRAHVKDSLQSVDEQYVEFLITLAKPYLPSDTLNTKLLRESFITALSNWSSSHRIVRVDPQDSPCMLLERVAGPHGRSSGYVSVLYSAIRSLREWLRPSVVLRPKVHKHAYEMCGPSNDQAKYVAIAGTLIQVCAGSDDAQRAGVGTVWRVPDRDAFVHVSYVRLMSVLHPVTEIGFMKQQKAELALTPEQREALGIPAGAIECGYEELTNTVERIARQCLFETNLGTLDAAETVLEAIRTGAIWNVDLSALGACAPGKVLQFWKELKNALLESPCPLSASGTATYSKVTTISLWSFELTTTIATDDVARLRALENVEDRIDWLERLLGWMQPATLADVSQRWLPQQLANTEPYVVARFGFKDKEDAEFDKAVSDATLSEKLRHQSRAFAYATVVFLTDEDVKTVTAEGNWLRWNDGNPACAALKRAAALKDGLGEAGRVSYKLGTGGFADYAFAKVEAGAAPYAEVVSYGLAWSVLARSSAPDRVVDAPSASAAVVPSAPEALYWTNQVWMAKRAIDRSEVPLSASDGARRYKCAGLPVPSGLWSDTIQRESVLEACKGFVEWIGGDRELVVRPLKPLETFVTDTGAYLFAIDKAVARHGVAPLPPPPLPPQFAACYEQVLTAAPLKVKDLLLKGLTPNPALDDVADLVARHVSSAVVQLHFCQLEQDSNLLQRPVPLLALDDVAMLLRSIDCAGLVERTRANSIMTYTIISGDDRLHKAWKNADALQYDCAKVQHNRYTSEVQALWCVLFNKNDLNDTFGDALETALRNFDRLAIDSSYMKEKALRALRSARGKGDSARAQRPSKQSNEALKLQILEVYRSMTRAAVETWPATIQEACAHLWQLPKFIDIVILGERISNRRQVLPFEPSVRWFRAVARLGGVAEGFEQAIDDCPDAAFTDALRSEPDLAPRSTISFDAPQRHRASEQHQVISTFWHSVTVSQGAEYEAQRARDAQRLTDAFKAAATSAGVDGSEIQSDAGDLFGLGETAFDKLYRLTQADQGLKLTNYVSKHMRKALPRDRYLYIVDSTSVSTPSYESYAMPSDSESMEWQSLVREVQQYNGQVEAHAFVDRRTDQKMLMPLLATEAAVVVVARILARHLEEQPRAGNMKKVFEEWRRSDPKQNGTIRAAAVLERKRKKLEESAKAMCARFVKLPVDESQMKLHMCIYSAYQTMMLDGKSSLRDVFKKVCHDADVVPSEEQLKWIANGGHDRTTRVYLQHDVADIDTLQAHERLLPSDGESLKLVRKREQLQQLLDSHTIKCLLGPGDDALPVDELLKSSTVCSADALNAPSSDLYVQDKLRNECIERCVDRAKEVRNARDDTTQAQAYTQADRTKEAMMIAPDELEDVIVRPKALKIDEQGRMDIIEALVQARTRSARDRANRPIRQARPKSKPPPTDALVPEGEQEEDVLNIDDEDDGEEDDAINYTEDPYDREYAEEDSDEEEDEDEDEEDDSEEEDEDEASKATPDSKGQGAVGADDDDEEMGSDEDDEDGEDDDDEGDAMSGDYDDDDEGDAMSSDYDTDDDKGTPMDQTPPLKCAWAQPERARAPVHLAPEQTKTVHHTSFCLQAAPVGVISTQPASEEATLSVIKPRKRPRRTQAGSEGARLSGDNRKPPDSGSFDDGGAPSFSKDYMASMAPVVNPLVAMRMLESQLKLLRALHELNVALQPKSARYVDLASSVSKIDGVSDLPGCREAAAKLYPAFSTMLVYRCVHYARIRRGMKARHSSTTLSKDEDKDQTGQRTSQRTRDKRELNDFKRDHIECTYETWFPLVEHIDKLRDGRSPNQLCVPTQPYFLPVRVYAPPRMGKSTVLLTLATLARSLGFVVVYLVAPNYIVPRDELTKKLMRAGFVPAQRGGTRASTSADAFPLVSFTVACANEVPKDVFHGAEADMYVLSGDETTHMIALQKFARARARARPVIVLHDEAQTRDRLDYGESDRAFRSELNSATDALSKCALSVVCTATCLPAIRVPALFGMVNTAEQRAAAYLKHQDKPSSMVNSVAGYAHLPELGKALTPAAYDSPTYCGSARLASHAWITADSADEAFLKGGDEKAQTFGASKLAKLMKRCSPMGWLWVLCDEQPDGKKLDVSAASLEAFKKHVDGNDAFVYVDDSDLRAAVQTAGRCYVQMSGRGRKHIKCFEPASFYSPLSTLLNLAQKGSKAADPFAKCLVASALEFGWASAHWKDSLDARVLTFLKEVDNVQRVGASKHAAWMSWKETARKCTRSLEGADAALITAIEDSTTTPLADDEAENLRTSLGQAESARPTLFCIENKTYMPVDAFGIASARCFEAAKTASSALIPDSAHISELFRVLLSKGRSDDSDTALGSHAGAWLLAPLRESAWRWTRWTPSESSLGKAQAEQDSTSEHSLRVQTSGGASSRVVIVDNEHLRMHGEVRLEASTASPCELIPHADGTTDKSIGLRDEWDKRPFITVRGTRYVPADAVVPLYIGAMHRLVRNGGLAKHLATFVRANHDADNPQNAAFALFSSVIQTPVAARNELSEFDIVNFRSSSPHYEYVCGTGSRAVLLVIYLVGMNPKLEDERIALLGFFADCMESAVGAAMRWNVRRIAAFGHDMFAAGTTLQCTHTTPAEPATLVRWCVRRVNKTTTTTRRVARLIAQKTFEDSEAFAYNSSSVPKSFPYRVVSGCRHATDVAKAYESSGATGEWVVADAFGDRDYEWYLVHPQSGTDPLGSATTRNVWLPNRTLHFCPKYMSIAAVDDSTDATGGKRKSSLDKLLQYVGRTFVDLKDVHVPGGLIGMRWKVTNAWKQSTLANGVLVDSQRTQIRLVLALARAFAYKDPDVQATEIAADDVMLVCSSMGWAVPPQTGASGTSVSFSELDRESSDGRPAADRSTCEALAAYAKFKSALVPPKGGGSSVTSASTMVLALLPGDATSLLLELDLTVDSYFVHAGCLFVNAAVEHQISLLSTREAVTNVRVYDAWERRLAALGRGTETRSLKPSQRSTVPMLLRQAVVAGKSLMRDDAERWTRFVNAHVGTCGASIKSILGYSERELNLKKLDWKKELLDLGAEADTPVAEEDDGVEPLAQPDAKEEDDSVAPLAEPNAPDSMMMMM
jgi:hypothetical protein